MVTQFVLRSDKKDRAGRCPVHLVVYFEGVRLKCATGEKCKPADWNADKQHFRRSYPLAEEANDLLRLMSDNVLKWCGNIPGRWALSFGGHAAVAQGVMQLRKLSTETMRQTSAAF